MKTINYLTIMGFALVGLSAFGCSSSSSCADGGNCAESGFGGLGGGQGAGTGGVGGGGGVTYFGLSPGTYCFKIVGTAPGTVDGCGIGVADYVGEELPVTYDMAAATIEVGNEGSLGRGHIGNNHALLSRDNMPKSAMMQTCTWHQTDTSMLELIAENTFTIAVAENQSAFDPACTSIPSGGMCASTWTWTMAIDSTVSPPTCH